MFRGIITKFRFIAMFQLEFPPYFVFMTALTFQDNEKDKCLFKNSIYPFVEKWPTCGRNNFKLKETIKECLLLEKYFFFFLFITRL